jgi:hypothetical protein
MVLGIGLGLVPLQVSAQESPSIRIVKPGDRRNVALGEVPISVEVSGVPGDATATWQIFIDGVPQGTVLDSTTTVVRLERPTGPHRLKAELYDAQGSILATHEILVMAAPVQSRDPVFNRDWFAPVMFGFTLVVFGIILVALRLHPRGAA